MNLILSELPEGVYPDDLADSADFDSRSYSSAELRAHATLLSALYENLSLIYSDKFLTSQTEGSVTEWERQLFATLQDQTLDFKTRQARLIAKFRAQGGLSHQALRNIVAGVLNLEFELSPWSGPFNGAWVLDESELEMGTYLTSLDPLQGQRVGYYALDCDLDYEASGLTLQDLTDIQESAYRYELRIFGHADDMTLSTLDIVLTHFEPARSQHLILNDHPGAEIVPVPSDLIEWLLDDSVLGDDTYLNFGKL